MELTIVFKINGNLFVIRESSLASRSTKLVVKSKGRIFLCNRSLQYELLSTGNLGNLTSEGETSGDSQNSENTQNFFHFFFPFRTFCSGASNF